jgi:hypothetical protein
MNTLLTGLLVLTLAAGPQAPAEPLQVRHTPAAEVNAGSDLVLHAQVTPAWRLQSLLARWRFAGETGWREAPFEKSAEGTFAAVIKIPRQQRQPVEYYVVARDTDGHEGLRFASPQAPQPVIVQSSQDELEREALLDVYGQKRSRVSLFGEYVSYVGLGQTTVGGTAYEDWYYRAEADYLYRLFEGGSALRIDSIRVGMGTLRGGVPSLYVPDLGSSGPNTRVGLDYGFSEVDLSFHPLFGLSGKLTLGGNARGFAAGFGGKVRIGRPRGSRVELEGDYVSGIGFTGGFRLAWDTVLRVPMSAAAQVTNVPGGPPGVRLLYRVGWDITEAFSLNAQLGYEARLSVAGGPSLGAGASFAW